MPFERLPNPMIQKFIDITVKRRLPLHWSTFAQKPTVTNVKEAVVKLLEDSSYAEKRASKLDTDDFMKCVVLVYGIWAFICTAFACRSEFPAFRDSSCAGSL